jgi:hypothetical protein
MLLEATSNVKIYEEQVQIHNVSKFLCIASKLIVICIHFN